MGQDQSKKEIMMHHLQELHKLDPNVINMRDELINLVKRHYDHCDRDSKKTNTDCHVPLPQCEACSAGLRRLHDHIHSFHKKLKEYTDHHPAVWPEGEEECHRKCSEQLSSYASNLMHEMKGIIEAETECDRAPVHKSDPAIRVQDFARPGQTPSPYQPAPMPPCESQDGFSPRESCQPGMAWSQGNDGYDSQATSRQGPRSSGHQTGVSQVTQYPATTGEHTSTAHQVGAPRGHIGFAKDITVVPPTCYPTTTEVKSPGTDDVFDPDTVALPSLHPDDKTPKAEQANPFDSDFTTLEAQLPAEVQQHPQFPHHPHSNLSTVHKDSTYECASVDPDSERSSASVGRHRAQPTLADAIPHEAGVDPDELTNRLAHIPSDSPPRRQHRPEPSLVHPHPDGFQDLLDLAKLADRLARVDVNARHHKVQASVASLGSIEEGEDTMEASHRAQYASSSRALEEGYDTEDSDSVPTLDAWPDSSDWGQPQNLVQAKQRAAKDGHPGVLPILVDAHRVQRIDVAESSTQTDVSATPLAPHPSDHMYKDTQAPVQLGNHVIEGQAPPPLDTPANHQNAPDHHQHPYHGPLPREAEALHHHHH